MSRSRPPESDSDARVASQHKVTGAWAGYLIFALIVLVLIAFDAQAAYNREWSNVAGITVFTLAFMVVPTGGLRWLRRFVRARKQPAGSGHRP